MTNHQRISHRSTLLVVLLLLLMTLQVPDLWWRDIGSGSITPRGTALSTSRTGAGHERRRLRHRKAVRPRRMQRRSRASEHATGHVRPQSKKLTHQDDHAQAADKTLPGLPKVESSAFRLATWPVESASKPNRLLSDSQRVTPYPPARIAARSPTRGEEDLDHSAIRTTPQELRSSSTSSAGASAPAQLDPLDVPDHNLLSDETAIVLTPELEHSNETSNLETWQPPKSLLRQFDKLRRLHCNQQVAAWIDECIPKLTALTATDSITSVDSAELLEDLAALAMSRIASDPATGNLSDDSHVRRAAYSLERRCKIWSAVRNVRLQGDVFDAEANPTRIADAVAAIESLLDQNEGERNAWKQFLRLAEISSINDSTLGGDRTQKRILARSVLDRLEGRSLTAEQRSFLENPQFVELSRSLQSWAFEPFDARLFLLSIENFESMPNTTTASTVIDQARNLSRFPTGSRSPSAHQAFGRHC